MFMHSILSGSPIIITFYLDYRNTMII